MKINSRLLIVVFVAFVLRLYGINWDHGFHLHPDERMLIMVADRIHFFDHLNPDFFSYGTLPIYLLKGISQLLDALFKTQFVTYDGMLYVGRSLSILFDLGTVIMIYKTAQLLFKKPSISLAAAFLYGVAFFPIQNTHFFVVDVFLSFFVISTLYAVLNYLHKPTTHQLLLIGVLFAASLATKVTAVIFLPLILATIVLDIFLEKKKTSMKKKLAHSALAMGIFLVTSSLSLFVFMPYLFLSFSQFSTEISQQAKMNSDASIFPYTLQYLGTLPYLYYLKNIVLWGLGPFISLLSITGIAAFLVKIKHEPKKNAVLWGVFSIFALLYFIVIGRSAVKFMRYMLPLYPFFAIFAGYGLYWLKARFQGKVQGKIVVGAIAAGIVVWTLSFVNIYSTVHTRITATDWILENVPKNATIAVEHWDDRLPIFGSENYQFVELTLYDVPDDDEKWLTVNANLQKADYLIIASNRLYVPLPKLSDCSKYPEKCYPQTTEYYKKLFSGELGFKKIAEFSAEPTVPFLGWSFSDQSADESFTVYDHPKIMIFKK